MEKSAKNLDKWMALLPEEIRRSVPIIYLAIPGSHNSMSYGISPKSAVTSDGSPMVKIANTIKPDYTYRWFKDQELNEYEQLLCGVRYFDLRICRLEKRPKFNFCHTLLSMSLTPPLRMIKKFLKEYSKEVVILDFQHFYDFDECDHAQLHRIICKIFGNLMVSTRETKLCNFTLNRAYDTQKRVIIIYRHESCGELFWPASSWPTPWPQTSDVRELKEFLKSSLYKRKPNKGHITQFVLTPSFEFVACNLDKCMIEIAHCLYLGLKDWISLQTPGVIDDKCSQPNINVVIADFINLKKNAFCRQIIKLNRHLLEENKN